jgi:hypothetical protein
MNETAAPPRVRKLCTHCGEEKPLTDDHVFPRCLFPVPSNERSIQVPSCYDCNNRSGEDLLKSFFFALDLQLGMERLNELKHPKGRGQLRALLRICSTDQGQVRVYPEEAVTARLKKMFQGLRRHLMGDEHWTFLGTADMGVGSLVKDGAVHVMRRLPLRVGGPNPAFIVPPDLVKVYDSFDCQFRDFSFSMKEPNVILLKYGRAWDGNEPTFVGAFWPPEEVGTE